MSIETWPEQPARGTSGTSGGHTDQPQIYQAVDIRSDHYVTCPAVGRTQEARRAETRRLLLDAATDLFARQGYHATSVEAVAAAADRTTGALYNHFGGKHGIVEALFQRGFEALTTSLRALRAIGQVLREALPAAAGIDVLVQGESPKRWLMERFREGAARGRVGCVLVASATFWEGFDVPGDSLQLVVIDKLPFPAPTDPLVQARSERVAAAGRSPFAHYAIPEAAVALKQGAGRLIRSETDRGILVVCDPRLASMGYGKRLLRALPPMRRLHSAQEFEEAIAALTRTATTHAPCP